jgi:hypothetical protein
MEFYSAIKKNKILSFAGTCMELENIILSEVKAKCCMFSPICGIQAQYKHKQYYIFIEIYRENVSKSGTDRGDQGSRKRKKVNNNETHHICVGTRHQKTH